VTRARIAAASAAILTVLLLQATLIGPVTSPWAVSLPAVLVAAVAIQDGPGPGIAFGFTLGLLADLGSDHPAGVLALCWLAVGLAAGLMPSRVSLLRDAVTVGLLGGVAALAGTGVLALVGRAGATWSDAFVGAGPAALGDALLALVVVPVVRSFLRNRSLRAPEPLLTELVATAALAGPVNVIPSRAWGAGERHG
jgi:rod shape-determining protein MreD